MSTTNKKWFSLNLGNSKKESDSCGRGSNTSGGCGSHNNTSPEEIPAKEQIDGFDQVFDLKMDRRNAFKKLTASLAIGAGAISTSCNVIAGDDSKEKAQIEDPNIDPLPF